MSRKELFLWWIFYIIISPIAIDYIKGIYKALGWIK